MCRTHGIGRFARVAARSTTTSTQARIFSGFSPIGESALHSIFAARAGGGRYRPECASQARDIPKDNSVWRWPWLGWTYSRSESLRVRLRFVRIG
jgi:hypothetical protein